MKFKVVYKYATYVHSYNIMYTKLLLIIILFEVDIVC